MADFKISTPNMTGDTETDIQSLYQAFIAQKKLLEYLLYNLDDSNILSVDAAKIKNLEATNIVSTTIVTETLYAGLANIAELTVDQWNTSTKVTKYLNSDITPVLYRRAYEEHVDSIVATTDGTATEQVVDRNGDGLYWVDDTHSGTQYEDNGNPVLQYVYTELLKRQEYFSQETDGPYYPVVVDGAGTGDGDKGKTFKYKDSEGYHIEYHHSTTDELIDIILNDDGVQIETLIAMGLTQIDLSSSGFTAYFDDGNSTSYTWTKDTEGRITKLTETDTAQEIIVNWL
ncbi:MAG: hypothetical protein ACQ5SW_08410 [Sphaerochaetaceae bacterium]